jgi:hypothetical protein
LSVVAFGTRVHTSRGWPARLTIHQTPTCKWLITYRFGIYFLPSYLSFYLILRLFSFFFVLSMCFLSLSTLPEHSESVTDKNLEYTRPILLTPVRGVIVTTTNWDDVRAVRTKRMRVIKDEDGCNYTQMRVSRQLRRRLRPDGSSSREPAPMYLCEQVWKHMHSCPCRSKDGTCGG